ncbi:hypothetical protein HYALB_00005765 [Hymenoscyphus albidus]|uniref:Glycosyltransferase family 17 protein n=1 Tax=Hymenoscyphus albidus TaxID=595503 RepID=A0A9N9Q731_9HELO|nr:hypothetical protein HYALB_00005765 [Hymenoscyphus albidus]
MLLLASHRRHLQRFSRTVRYRWKSLTIGLLLIWLTLLYKESKEPSTNTEHTITTHSFELENSFRQQLSVSPSSLTGLREPLPIEQSKAICTQHKFKPYPQRTPQRKVYDLFMINDELDWLEIRLHTLAAHVDYFVILESPYTFTGKPKPLVLKENWSRFAEFHSQMIYHAVEDMPVGSSRAWDYEDHQRNALYTQVIPGLEGEKKANIGDVLIVADIDEIPRPITITILRNCQFPHRLTLRSQFYYYAFEWKHNGEEWAHPQATVYRGPSRTILPYNLRNGDGGNPISRLYDKAELWNAGWHCSTCFRNISQVLSKMASFSHTSLNEEKFQDRKRIVGRIRKGLDLWDREGETYTKIRPNNDIPEYVKHNGVKFSYLINRDSADAGFADYDV